MNPTWIPILVGGGAALLVFLAEALHARRVRRIRRLAFGPEARPRPWTRAVAPLRSLALGVFTAALTVLILAQDTQFREAAPAPGPGTRHLVFIADVSPSMLLADAGPKRDQPRRARMADVMEGVLERVGGDVTFSVIAFYSNALPVVLQVRDRAVVRNVFDGMPLVFAMEAGQTDLGLSLNRALELIAAFPEASTTVFIGTDGDTTPLAHPLFTPASVDRVTVLGVGDTERGTFIDGHMSRQDGQVLRAVAAALNAEYLDVNDRQVPTPLLRGLMPGSARSKRLSRVDGAILAMTLTSALLAFLPVAQQYAGASWRVLRPAPAARIRTEGA